MWEERGRRQRRRQRERARRHSEAGRPGPLCARAPPPSSGDGRSPGAPSCAHARPRRPRALGPAHNVNAPPRLRKGVGPLSLDTEPSFSFTHGQRASAASCRSTRHRDYFASSGPDRLCRLQLASSEHLLFPAVSPRLSSCSERTCDAALVALHRRATPESSRGSRATSRVRVRLLPACLEMHRSSQELPAAKQAVEREEDTRVAFPLVSRPGHTESSRERMRGDTGCGSIRGGETVAVVCYGYTADSGLRLVSPPAPALPTPPPTSNLHCFLPLSHSPAPPPRSPSPTGAQRSVTREETPPLALLLLGPGREALPLPLASRGLDDDDVDAEADDEPT